MKEPVIAITMGDPAGIGPEIILKALKNKKSPGPLRILVIGTREILQTQATQLGVDTRFEIIDVPIGGREKIIPGEVSAEAGMASYQYVTQAIVLAKEKKIDAVVTAPITKASIQKARLPFLDHTEIFAQHFNGRAVTLLANPRLKVAHVMRHLSVKESVLQLTAERIFSTIVDTDRGMKAAYRLESPRIMVTGLNPHNGDGGLMGNEEHAVIAPAVAEARAAGVAVFGPVPADSAFAKALEGDADVVVAMFHDQGHIAIKASDWKRSHGITIGLNIVRTSVDHGSALDIAGKGIAYEDSLVTAINSAWELASR